MTATDRLTQIEARVATAPEGQWYVEADGSVWVDHSDGDRDSMSGLTGTFPIWAGGAAAFIAHAHQDVPDLTGALRKLLELADHWARLSGEAMDPEARAWTAAASASVRKAIEEAL